MFIKNAIYLYVGECLLIKDSKAKFCTAHITTDGTLCHFKLQPHVPSFVITYHLSQTDGCQKHIEWFLFQMHPAALLRFMDQVTHIRESIFQTVQNYSNLLVTNVSYCHKWVTRSVYNESQVSWLLRTLPSQNCNLIMSIFIVHVYYKQL